MLTNLVPGVCPDSTAAHFDSLSGPSLTWVSIDASSSPLFAPGSVLTSTGRTINLGLEPTSAALMAAGLITLVWRRRKAG